LPVCLGPSLGSGEREFPCLPHFAYFSYFLKPETVPESPQALFALSTLSLSLAPDSLCGELCFVSTFEFMSTTSPGATMNVQKTVDAVNF
jgi:hypothetical protein